MSVDFRDPLDSPVVNAAYLSRTTNTSASGVISLLNSDSNNVTDLQKALNKIFQSTGVGTENNISSNNYTDENYISNGDAYKLALDKLDQALKTEEISRQSFDEDIQTQLAEGAIGFKRYATDSEYIADNIDANEGEALQGGEAYFNTTVNRIRFYNDVAALWETIDSALIAIQQKPVFVADPGGDYYDITQFPISVEALQVYIDGVLLDKSDWDFNYNDAKLTLINALAPGQEIYVYYLTQGIPTQPIFSKQEVIEFINIDSVAIANKRVSISGFPVNGAVALVDVVRQLGALQPGVDFVNTAVLADPNDPNSDIGGYAIDWDGQGFENDAADGMVLRVLYFEVN